MKRLFGTDGIRGVAGDPPLDATTVRRFGAALAELLEKEHPGSCRVVLGRDTRESGPWLRDAIASGLATRGVAALDAGVITTPGLAHVTSHFAFDAGVMISASHNPFHDNGLKAFDATGFKLSDALESRLEQRILDPGAPDPPDRPVRVAEDGELIEGYVEFLKGVMPTLPRPGRPRVILDCANGSASRIAPAVFRHAGAEVETLACEPDGRNINLGCGSLHLESLAQAVRLKGFDLGIAFDGDADRALAVDRNGRVADGDCILFLAARRMKRKGSLRGNALVATIMSNLWLEKRLAREGIALHRAPVGDKYVLERMLEQDLLLGGEQSGHVIFREHASTGDGILTGLLLLDTLENDGEPLEAVLDGIVRFPQVLLAVPVRNKPDLSRHPVIGPAVDAVRAALGDSGRVVLRYSGTEPVARVMVEGTDRATVTSHAEDLIRLIEEQLGG